MVALLLAVAAGSEQEPDLAQRVTLEARAMRAAVLVKVLEGKTGVRFRTSPDTAEQVLVVWVHDVPLGSLMNRISSVTSARWVQEKEYVVLKRPAEVERRQREEYLKERADLIKKAIAKLYEATGAAQTLETAAAEKLLEARGTAMKRESEGAGNFGTLSRLDDRLPFGRAIARLAAGIDPMTLAALQPQSKMVFSPTPTSRQYAVSGGASVLSKLASEHAAVIEAAAGRPGGLGRLPSYRWGSPAWHSQALQQQPKKVLLIASTQGAVLGNISLELEVAGGDGGVIYTGSTSLGSYGELMPVPAATSPAWLDQTTTLELDPLTRELSDYFRSSGQPLGESAKLSPGLLASLTHPEEHDPLSFHATDILLTIAKTKKTQLVACLPDAAFNTVQRTVRTTKPSIKEVWPMLVGYVGAEVELEAGWLLAKPRNPWLARQYTVPRTVLGEFARAVNEAGYTTLAAQANLNRSYRDTDFMSLPKAYSSLLGAYLSGDSFSDLDGRLSRFAGSLSQEQWKTLQADGELEASLLSQQALSALAELIYNRRLSVLEEGSPDGRIVYKNFLIRCEPTEGLPEAQLRAGKVKLTRQVRDMVFSPVPQRRAFVAYGATGVAYQLLTREKTDRDPDEFLPDDKFIFGSANSYQFQFSFPGSLLWADLLADRRFDPRAKPQPLASMPEGFRKSVEAELEKLRKSGG